MRVTEALRAYLSVKKVYILFFITVFSIFIVYANQKYIVIPQLYKQSINETLKVEIINYLFKYGWASYFFSFLIILSRVFFVSICLYIGGILFDNFGKQQYSSCFNIALKADIFLVCSSLIFILFVIIMGYDDALNFSQKTSLLGFFNIETVESWLLVPLGIFNIFEIVYCFFLAAFLSVSANKTYKESMNFVIATYGTGLLLYILVIIFVVLYVSQ